MTFSKTQKTWGLRAAAITGVALLTACQPANSPYMNSVALDTQAIAAAQAPTNTQGCGVGSVRWLVGQPESSIASINISGPMRVVPVGGAVTMDHVPNRKNFILDVDGRIARITCG